MKTPTSTWTRINSDTSPRNGLSVHSLIKCLMLLVLRMISIWIYLIGAVRIGWQLLWRMRSTFKMQLQIAFNCSSVRTRSTAEKEQHLSAGTRKVQFWQLESGMGPLRFGTLSAWRLCSSITSIKTESLLLHGMESSCRVGARTHSFIIMIWETPELLRCSQDITKRFVGLSGLLMASNLLLEVMTTSSVFGTSSNPAQNTF